MFDDRTRNLGGSDRRAGYGVRDLARDEHVGPWRVSRILGGGGFGTVYEVRHERTEQPGALKLLHAQFVTSAEMVARFDREIDVLRRLSHPNIVGLIDAGVSADERPYLCMELLEGEELGKIISECGVLDPHRALEIFEPMCDALASAHDRGVIHRDLKASNVLICRDRAVLLDFGIAKLSDALAPELTASRQALGTPSCMAPEQIHGSKVDGRTDVYALGGLLFHMLTGRLPFQDPSPTMTQYLHLHARRPSVSSLISVSRRLDDVISRAMAIEPKDRFADPRALLAAARSALRESSMMHAPSGEVPCVAILVSASDRGGGSALDAALLDDLEGVLPTAEQLLLTQGFQLAVDLGSSSLFVTRAENVPDPVALATAVFDELARRPRRDPRVRIGVGVHREQASYIGTELQPGPILRPATWALPDAIEGVWVTGKIDPTAPTGRCIRI